AWGGNQPNPHEIQKPPELAPLLLLQIQTGVLGNRTTTKKPKGGAPALGGLGGSSILLFLTNILIQLLHLS
uniref:CAMPATH-1 antigen n=1 Tax=Catagonus wagneri TaxID=51154 RepID=A0A8C3YG43_9CETA